MQHIFSPGSHNSWIPDFLKTPSSTTLGSGGNGIIFSYTVANTDFAVKEVNLWGLIGVVYVYMCKEFGNGIT